MHEAPLQRAAPRHRLGDVTAPRLSDLPPLRLGRPPASSRRPPVAATSVTAPPRCCRDIGCHGCVRSARRRHRRRHPRCRAKKTAPSARGHPRGQPAYFEGGMCAMRGKEGRRVLARGGPPRRQRRGPPRCLLPDSPSAVPHPSATARRRGGGAASRCAPPEGAGADARGRAARGQHAEGGRGVRGASRGATPPRRGQSGTGDVPGGCVGREA